MSPIDYSGLPEHLRDGMRRYVEDGVEPGSFLRACLRNDLKWSFHAAQNPADIIGVVRFLYNEAPGECWGDTTAVRTWILYGGLRGLEAERKS